MKRNLKILKPEHYKQMKDWLNGSRYGYLCGSSCLWGNLDYIMKEVLCGRYGYLCKAIFPNLKQDSHYINTWYNCPCTQYSCEYETKIVKKILKGVDYI